MPDTFLCNKCGAPTLGPDPTGGLDELCPRCVLGFAMDGEAAPPPAVAEPGLKPGSTLGNYEVLGQLGKGGMGVVYKARDIKLDRMVALKVLSPEFAADQEFVHRFEREAMALARLRHPNIVQIHEINRVGDLLYLAMEFIPGVTLRKLLSERSLPPEEALLIVPQLCDALEYAHAQGVVHRDIKPENILIDKTGAVKIADFGLAKFYQGHKTEAMRLTRTNVVMGTPHYMAPEQVENPTNVDHRADIYSMGVVFYEMLTGELPIGRFHPPSRKARTGGRLDQIVMKSLEKAPDERYQRASHVKTDLGNMNGPGAAVAPPAVATENTPLPVLSTLAVVISSVLAIVIAGNHGRPETAAMVAVTGLLAGWLGSAWRAWIDPATAHGSVKNHVVLSVVMSGVVAIVLMGTHRAGEEAAMVAGTGLVSAIAAAIFHAWRLREAAGQAGAATRPSAGRRPAEIAVAILLVIIGIWAIQSGGFTGVFGGVTAIIGGASVFWKHRPGVSMEVKSGDRVVYAEPPPVPPPAGPAKLSLLAAAGCLLSVLTWVLVIAVAVVRF